MADLTLRLVKGTELTFGELDANFQMLDSDITGLSARLDSIGGGLDSAQVNSLISTAVDSDIAVLTSRVDSNQGSISTLSTRLDSNQSSIADLSARVDSAGVGYNDSDVISLLTGSTSITLDASPTDGASDDF